MRKCFIIFGILLPFIEFINTNIILLDKVIIINLFFLIINFFFIFFIIIFFKKKLFSKNKYFDDIEIIFIIILNLTFRYKEIRDSFSFFLRNYFNKEIYFSIFAIFIILCISIIFIYFLKFKKFKIFIINFVVLYSISISLVFTFNYSKKSEYKFNSKKNNFDFLLPDKKNIKPNIYLVTINLMTSLDQVEKIYNVTNNDFKNDMKSKNYKVREGKSITNLTYETMTSIFNLEYPIIHEGKLIKNKHKMFPAILANTKNNKLINLLEKFNYNFYWIGNAYANCEMYNKTLCLDGGNLKKKNYFNFLNFYVIESFISSTPLISIINQINNFQYTEFDKNDATQNLINYLENSEIKKNSFFFINDFNLRFQNFDDNCKYKKNKLSKRINKQFIINQSYLNSYECILKRINKISSLIEVKDPNSFVIFHGDHGIHDQFYDPKSDNINYTRLYNFIAHKSHKNCKIKPNNNYLNSLQLLNIFFRCLSTNKEEVKIIGNKYFYMLKTPNSGVFNVIESKN